MNKFIRGDFVIVISGKKKNFKGEIIKIKNDFVQLSCFNFLKKNFKLKYFKKNIFTYKVLTFLVHISKISLFNFNNNSLVKFGCINLFNKKKIRYLKK